MDDKLTARAGHGMTPDSLADAMTEAAFRLESIARLYQSRRLRLLHSRLATSLRVGAIIMRDATTEGVDPGDIPGTYLVRLPYP